MGGGNLLVGKHIAKLGWVNVYCRGKGFIRMTATEIEQAASNDSEFAKVLTQIAGEEEDGAPADVETVAQDTEVLE